MSENSHYCELKCPKCGFEFKIYFSENETEESKKKIKLCPCGCIMKVVNTSTREGV